MKPTAKPLPVRGDSIELGQAVKLSGIAGSGGEAKFLVASGRIRVNGKVEGRRGHRLRDGDVIEIDRRAFRVTCAP